MYLPLALSPHTGRTVGASVVAYHTSDSDLRTGVLRLPARSACTISGLMQGVHTVTAPRASLAPSAEPLTPAGESLISSMLGLLLFNLLRAFQQRHPALLIFRILLLTHSQCMDLPSAPCLSYTVDHANPKQRIQRKHTICQTAED